LISLFLGELYSLGTMRRVFCVFAGFALSFLFNLARMACWSGWPRARVWRPSRRGTTRRA
jgi:hypothetical protein